MSIKESVKLLVAAIIFVIALAGSVLISLHIADEPTYAEVSNELDKIKE